MKLKPLEASLFIDLDDDIKQPLLQSGVIPVNDIYLQNWGNKNPINIYYGSYGSGKTVDIFDEHIYKAYNDKYFRCFFGRAVYEDVRETIFQTLIDRIRELNLERFFSFSDKPNGTMNVVCKKNNNMFLPFGCSNAKSLKGIKDPSHIIVDELDQITFEDFGLLFSRLRTTKAVTQFYGALNTEKVYKSHWVRSVLFDGIYKDKAYKLKANYVDNVFLDQADYYEKLKLIANGNEVTLNAIANGEWGVVRTGQEFWKSFDEYKHVKEIIMEQFLPLHITLDENVNPYITQLVFQVDADDKKIVQVHEVLSRSPHNNAPKAAMQMVRWLTTINYKNVLYIYGDPSASRRSTVDENSASFYDKYIEVLQSYGYIVESRVGKSAPEVALSAAFINAIYEANYEGWSIEISKMCFISIDDYMLVKEEADGTMAKPKDKDKDTKIQFEPQGHCSDAKRYFIIKVLEDLFIKFKSRKAKLYAK